MRIQEIIQELNTSNKYIGFQLSKSSGLLNTTWLLYNKNGAYYFFDINQKIEFVDAYRYTSSELIEELKSSNLEIELSIN